MYDCCFNGDVVGKDISDAEESFVIISVEDGQYIGLSSNDASFVYKQADMINEVLTSVLKLNANCGGYWEWYISDGGDIFSGKKI